LQHAGYDVLVAGAKPPSESRAHCNHWKFWLRKVDPGAYANLVKIALQFNPLLLFLNPSEQQCLDNCRARPWEAHKYPSKDEQDKRLAFLLSWVSDYYTRDGEMSLSAHRSCFSAYAGKRQELRQLPRLEPPSREVLSWIA
jgi:hypothetical protein